MPETIFSKIFFVLLVSVLCVIAVFFYGGFLWAIIDGKTGFFTDLYLKRQAKAGKVELLSVQDYINLNKLWPNDYPMTIERLHRIELTGDVTDAFKMLRKDVDALIALVEAQQQSLDDQIRANELLAQRSQLIAARNLKV